MKFGQLVNYNMINNLFQKSARLVADLFLEIAK